jgi:ATP phosphoribosyltransferase
LARKSHLRVAAKFVRITERFFGEEAVPVDVIKLSGAVELAPVMGLADAVVDLVETGETLRENGLVEVREILRTSARLIVNRASQKTRREEVGEFIRVCQRKLGS